MMGTIACITVSLCLLASCSEEKVDFETKITEIDNRLVAGALQRADEEIQAAVSLAGGRSDWLALSKRAYTLGAAAGSYEALFTVSRSGIKEISGAEEIAALCVFAALRTGRIEIGYRYASEYLESDRWVPLKREAVLRKSAFDQEVLIQLDGEDPLFSAVYTEDPVRLARAADLFGDERFDLAAALRYAAAGEMENAAKTIKPHAARFPEPAFLLLYDAGRYGDAKNAYITSGLNGLELVLADAYLKLGERENALDLYTREMRENKEESPVPYINASYIEASRGNNQEALDILRAALEIFPEDRRLLLAEITVRGEAGEPFEKLIEEYKTRYPNDPDMAVVTARLMPSRANRIRLENALWVYVLENPANSRYAGYLAASLIASQDTEGLSRLIGVWEEANGTTGWSLFLEGYRAVLEENADAAIEAFSRSYGYEALWETAYNLGVLFEKKKNYDRAIESFRKAETNLAQLEEAVEKKAFVRAAIARVHYTRGDFDAAHREASYAIDLDPGSEEAALIKSLLENNGD